MTGTMKCTEMVSSKDAWERPYRCQNTAKHDPDQFGTPTKCGIHSAAAEAKRQAKKDARYADFKRRLDQGALKFEALNIVRQIADGHDDPRALCVEWVQKWKETE